MKLFNITILLVWFLAFIGCCSALSVHADQQTNLITGYGEWKCFTNLTVIVNAEDKKISLKSSESGIPMKLSGPHLRANKGWFVFAESDQRIWIYNGSGLNLAIITPQIGWSLYDSNFPVTIPPIVSRKVKASSDHGGK